MPAMVIQSSTACTGRAPSSHWRRRELAPSAVLTPIDSQSSRDPFSRALKERGQAVHTRFLLRWTWDEELRHAVHKGTTKVEGNHQFAKFLNFRGEGALKANIPADQEKAIVYNELVADAVAAQTVNDLTHALNKLHDRGIDIAAEDLAHSVRTRRAR
jgi:TnpA family transposase